MKIHELKTDPTPFYLVANGEKPFEFRKNDRDFQTGDYLLLKCWNNEHKTFTSEHILVKVTHMLLGGRYGIPEDYCIMTIKVLDAEEVLPF